MTRPLRIGINLLWLVPGVVGGSEEYVTRLLAGVAAAGADDMAPELFALSTFPAAHPRLAERFPTHLLPMSGRFKPLRVAAESTWLARAGRRRQLDLMHHFGGVVPPGRLTPALVTIHDLQPLDQPDSFGAVKLAYLRTVLPRTIGAARLVCAVSHFTRRSVVRLLGVPAERVVVVPHGIAPLQRATASWAEVERVRAAYDLPGPWFVYPAITYAHKNHLTLVRAFAAVAAARPTVTLVLTHRAGPAEGEVRREIDRLGLAARVRRIGWIPRADVDALIAGAAAVTFPSRYEGFGAPVLEAMARGCPVVAADAAALPEVVADAGILVPADDPDAWARSMHRLLDDDRLRTRLAGAGRARAAGFGWDRAAAAQLDAWRLAADRPGSSPGRTPP